jgi:GDPmannose 4,6-dehydratase
MQIKWHGSGIDEHGIDAHTGTTVIRIDSRYFRPTEVDTLLGDASKARAELGWEPEVEFATLVEEMVREDLALAQRDALIADEGYPVFKHHE